MMPESTKCICRASIGAGPDPSTFPVSQTLCATVRPSAARAAILSTLKQKRSMFEAKIPHLALEGVES